MSTINNDDGMADLKCTHCTRPWTLSFSDRKCTICTSTECQGDDGLMGVAVPCGHWFCVECAVKQYRQLEGGQFAEPRNTCLNKGCEQVVEQVLVLEGVLPEDKAGIKQCLEDFRDVYGSSWPHFSGRLYYREPNVAAHLRNFTHWTCALCKDQSGQSAAVPLVYTREGVKPIIQHFKDTHGGPEAEWVCKICLVFGRPLNTEMPYITVPKVALADHLDMNHIKCRQCKLWFLNRVHLDSHTCKVNRTPETKEKNEEKKKEVKNELEVSIQESIKAGFSMAMNGAAMVQEVAKDFYTLLSALKQNL